MKFDAQTTAGDVRRSVRKHNRYAVVAALAALTIAWAGGAAAQSLYKYKGPNGEWIYADRPPGSGQQAEVRVMNVGQKAPQVSVTHRLAGQHVELVASNDYFAPIELVLALDDIEGLEFPDAVQPMRFVLEPQQDTVLISLALKNGFVTPSVKYRYDYLAGDPQASHKPVEPYRVPYAIASDYPVTQAFPDVITHNTPDSRHAVDIAMPIGTDIFAARGGVVFDVAGHHYRGGLDKERDMPSANLIRILHDDGTYAIYAHLNWNSIRVKPGDRVSRGQYIAESGNTGYSTGPHLHFAVVRNTGMKIESVPVKFRGLNSRSIIPATGNVLTAH